MRLSGMLAHASKALHSHCSVMKSISYSIMPCHAYPQTQRSQSLFALLATLLNEHLVGDRLRQDAGLGACKLRQTKLAVSRSASRLLLVVEPSAPC